MSPTFGHYLAVGDSISIDLYPGLDVQEREGLERMPTGLGAASLLYRNDDRRWPEFEGRDLVSRFPGIRFHDLTADGATTDSVLAHQLDRVPEELEGPVLVTLTVGGNDLLGLLDFGLLRFLPWFGGDEEDVERIARQAERIVVRLLDAVPEPTLLVGDVYDPTDGTADLGDGVVREEALSWLHRLNDRLLGIARERGAVPVEIHEHFLGHGRSEPDPEARWYWRHSIIEPSARGASEVRRLWLEALGL